MFKKILICSSLLLSTLSHSAQWRHFGEDPNKAVDFYVDISSLRNTNKGLTSANIKMAYRKTGNYSVFPAFARCNSNVVFRGNGATYNKKHVKIDSVDKLPPQKVVEGDITYGIWDNVCLLGILNDFKNTGQLARFAKKYPVHYARLVEMYKDF